MDAGELPLFAMLRSRLGYLNERQRLISENVANGNSKGFTPKDLTPFTFQAQVAQTSVTAAVTQPGHIMPAGAAGSNGGGRFKAKLSPDSEKSLDGNSVVLEEQMQEMSDSRMNYDAAVTFYQKSLNLVRMAGRAPGR